MSASTSSAFPSPAQAKNESICHFAAENATTSGEVIAFERPGSVAKAEYVEAIGAWIEDRADCLSRVEIGAMDAFDRIDAQRKSLILNLAHYYRKHPRSDVAPGVAAVITLMSDNDKGAATISQQRMADLFGRSRAAIAEAQARLRDDGIIVTSRGRTAGSHPVIPRAVTKTYNHMAWMLDAVCAPEARVNCQARPDNYKLSSPARQFSKLSGAAGHIQDGNCQVDASKNVQPGRHNFTIDNSIPLNARAREDRIGKAAAAIAAGMAAAAASLPAAAAPVEPPAHVMPAPIECWSTQKARMEAGTNINEKRAQDQIWKTPTGLLEVSGGFKEELVREFPDVDLKCGLATAAPNVATEHGALRCMQSVRRQFGYMQQDALRRKRPVDRQGSPDRKAATGGRDIFDMRNVPTSKPRPADEVSA